MQRTPSGRRRYTPAQRDRILAACDRSRLSQKDFAAQVGVGNSTLSLWRRQAASGKPTLVPMPNLFGAAAAPAAYRVQLPRGVMVEIAAGFRPEELGALLQVIQAV